MEISLPFNELDFLKENLDLVVRGLELKDVSVYSASDPKAPNPGNRRAMAVPGKPVPHFFNSQEGPGPDYQPPADGADAASGASAGAGAGTSGAKKPNNAGQQQGGKSGGKGNAGAAGGASKLSSNGSTTAKLALLVAGCCGYSADELATEDSKSEVCGVVGCGQVWSGVVTHLN